MTLESRIIKFLDILEEDYYEQYNIIYNTINPYLGASSEYNPSIIKILEGLLTIHFTPEELQFLNIDKMLKDMKDHIESLILSKETVGEIFSKDKMPFNAATVDLLIAIGEKDPKIFDSDIPQISSSTIPSTILINNYGMSSQIDYEFIVFTDLKLYILTDIFGNHHFNFNNFHLVIKDLVYFKNVFKLEGENRIAQNIAKYLDNLIPNLTSKKHSRCMRLKTNIPNVVNVISHISRSIMLEILNSIKSEYILSCNTDRILVRKNTVDIKQLPYSEFLSLTPQEDL